MTVKVLLRLVNEEGADIYQLSLDAGFSKGTLRQRLIALGYKQEKATGKWVYVRTDGNEPLDTEICYPSKRKTQIPTGERDPKAVKGDVDIFTAILQLPPENQKITHSFKADKMLVERMKGFIKEVPLQEGKVYSLAIYEFLEKYESTIEKLKSENK